MARDVHAHFFDRYFRATQGPWPSLLIVLPLIALYEAGSRGLLGFQEAGPADQLVAFSLLKRGFDAAGATGAMLPALTLVACLLGWHIAERDSWAVRPRYLLGMAIEGALLALPIVGAAMLMSRWLPCAALSEAIQPRRLATLAVGAAVYEELLFRLIAFAVIHGLAVDVAGLGRRAGGIVTIFGSAALFAAYHYLGQESFEWPSFVFRTGAGLFLGAIFATRGFGVTAICHAVYDLVWIAVFWRSLPG